MMVYGMTRSIYFYCYCCKNIELKSNGVLDGQLFIVLNCNCKELEDDTQQF